MKIKKLFLILFLITFSICCADAKTYTQSLTVGENHESFTQYHENTDTSFYKEEETEEDKQQIIYVPVETPTYTYSRPYTYTRYSSYYPITGIGIYSNRPYNCFKAPCPIGAPTQRPHNTMPHSGGYPPQIGRHGGVQVHTNFAGGYNFGGEIKNLSPMTPIGRPHNFIGGNHPHHR